MRAQRARRFGRGALRWHRARESESGRSAVPFRRRRVGDRAGGVEHLINSFRRNEDDTVIVGEHDVVTRDQVFAEARAQERGTCGMACGRVRIGIPDSDAPLAFVRKLLYYAVRSPGQPSRAPRPALRVVGSRARSASPTPAGFPMQAAPCQLGPARQPARPAYPPTQPARPPRGLPTGLIRSGTRRHRHRWASSSPFLCTWTTSLHRLQCSAHRWKSRIFTVRPQMSVSTHCIGCRSRPPLRCTWSAVRLHPQRSNRGLRLCPEAGHRTLHR